MIFQMKFAPLFFGTLAMAAFAFGASAASSPKAETKVKRKFTYATDVAAIFNEKCVTCHRPGEVAPFSLIGYENAKKWAHMSAHVTAKRIMPPWKAVHGYGDFRGENRLTDEQIEAIQQWDKDGAPRGAIKDEPKAPTFPSSEWMLGKPDVILSPEKAFKLGAEGPDLYRNFVLHNDSKETMWVVGTDVRPGNKKIVHHVITFLDRAHNGRKLEEETKDGQPGYTSDGGGVGFLPSGSLGGWAPGIRATHTPVDTAFKVDPGTDFVLQVHYHRSGKEETDLTKVGLYLTKEPPAKTIQLQWLFNFNVNIQPGDKQYTLRREYTVPADITLYSVMPHMHLLGKSMKAWLELPDGTKKPLVYVDNWDFNWQLNYVLNEPLKVPKGTKEVVEAVYDNSTDNPRNPNNPPKRVTWGEATTDEMFLLIASYTIDSPKQ